MKTTQSLNELTVSNCEFNNVASREMAVRALGANMTLESLRIQTDEDNGGIMESFLLHLGTHPCLRELKLVGGRGDPRSLGHVGIVASFLRTSRTLEHLSLTSYRFNKDTLEAIIEGIHSNESLTKLTIVKCEFDSESTMLFQDILKPKNDDSTIRELLLGEVTFDQRPVGSVVSSILSPKQVNNDNRSKNGEIISLYKLAMFGKPGDNFQSIFEMLGNKSTSIQLRCFHYGQWTLDLAGCDALAACLPKLIYLEELGILDDVAPALKGSPVHKERLLRALKQNGSLQNIKITASWSDFLTAVTCTGFN
jgi:hypothetical protein